VWRGGRHVGGENEERGGRGGWGVACQRLQFRKEVKRSIKLISLISGQNKKQKIINDLLRILSHAADRSLLSHRRKATASGRKYHFFSQTLSKKEISCADRQKISSEMKSIAFSLSVAIPPVKFFFKRLSAMVVLESERCSMRRRLLCRLKKSG